MRNVFKDIKTAKELLDVMDDLCKIDADGDGVADLKEHASAAQRVAPHVLSAQKNLMELQKDLDAIKAELGADFELFMMDFNILQERVQKALA